MSSKVQHIDINLESFSMEDLYLNVLNNLEDGLYFVDTDRRICFWNNAAERITGYPASEMIGKHCHESNLNHIDDRGRPLCLMACPLFASMIDGNRHKDNVFVRHRDGHRIPISVNISPIRINGKLVGALETFSKTSQTVYNDSLVEQLTSQAMTDGLTNLPNRRFLEDYLDYAFDRFRSFGEKFAVMMMDIDSFRAFNNNYGHAIGDMVLSRVSAELKKTANTGDIIGRWGGEEFIGIFGNIEENTLFELADQFRSGIEKLCVYHNELALSVTISVGITLVNIKDDIKSVLHRADHLMYRSKAGGRNRTTSG